MHDSVIGEMSLFTNNEIHLAAAPSEVREVKDETNGAIVFARTLTGWNGGPLARLIITNTRPSSANSSARANGSSSR